MSRTENAIKNTTANFILFLVSTVLAFITRIFFTKILGEDYLGVNNVLTNIIAMLSIAELGIGTAINFCLYKPIAENNIPHMKALMNYYKKAYYVIGGIVFVIGIIFLLFINVIIPDPGSVKNLWLIFIIYIINSSYSYFFTYKVTMLEASQKGYMAAKINIFFSVIIHIGQLIVLVVTKNYILYLILNVILTFLQRIIINRKINQLYPFLKEQNNEKIEEKEKKVITKNVKALIFHKIGDYCINGTDNIIISMFVSIGMVGKYSNYALLITTVNSFITTIFSSLVSGVGNLLVTESESKKKQNFLQIRFISFWIYGFSFICFLVLIDPFINIVFGSQYVLNFSVVLVILLNFYVTGMRMPTTIFKNSAGLYDQDKFIPIMQSIVNLIFSIILAKMYGIIGVFLGTLISSLALPNWHRPYILYKNIFKESPKSYYLQSLKYFIIVAASALFTKTICDLFFINSFIGFGIRMIYCLILSNLFFLLFTFKSKEFKEVFQIVKGLKIWKKFRF